MKRGWLMLLVVSLGLNAGLFGAALYERLTRPERATAGGAGRGWSRGREAWGEAALDTTRGRAYWDSVSAQRVARLVDRLGLTREEGRSLLRLRQESVPRIMRLREGVWAARRQLQAAYSADPIDTTRVRNGLPRLALAQARVDSLVAQTMLDELALLNPDQKAAYLAALPWQGVPPRGPGTAGLRQAHRHGRR